MIIDKVCITKVSLVRIVIDIQRSLFLHLRDVLANGSIKECFAMPGIFLRSYQEIFSLVIAGHTHKRSFYSVQVMTQNRKNTWITVCVGTKTIVTNYLLWLGIDIDDPCFETCFKFEGNALSTAIDKKIN